MSETVAGTRIQRASDDDRERTLLISDLHVPRDGGAVLSDFEAVLADARARAAQTRVLVLGDLFEFLVGHKQLSLGKWADTVAALRRSSDAGVSITVLHGNRDFMMDRRFADRAGCRVVPGGLRFRLGERDCLALHGDELCTKDLAYQRSKVWLRHPITRVIIRNLPISWAMRIGQRVRKESGESFEPRDPARYDAVAGAVRSAFAIGVDLLVFGHVHRPARGMFDDRSYAVLPAFDQEPVLLESEGGKLWFRRADGSRVDDYPGRTFPE